MLFRSLSRVSHHGWRHGSKTRSIQQVHHHYSVFDIVITARTYPYSGGGGEGAVMAVREETEEEQSCGVDYLAFGLFVCRVGFIRISCWFDVELETIIGRSINATNETVCQSANRSNVCLVVDVLSQNPICPDCVSVGFSFSVSRILTRLALAFEFFVFFFDFFYYFSLRKFGCHWCS
jgi:hypothetical protein